MVARETIKALAEAIQKRANANEVAWIMKPNKYAIALPDFHIGLSRFRSQTSLEPEILFEIDTPEGKEVEVVQIKAGEAEYDLLNALIASAEEYASQWNQRLATVAKLIEKGTGPVGGWPVTTTTTPPPPVPSRPADQKVIAFFEKIAGEWDLTYERRSGADGGETLRIDKTGNYFVIPRQATRLPNTMWPIHPKYRLTLLSCDSALQHVEVAKQELNGKTKQIEVLTISANVMEGFAKHDEHRLTYKRLSSG